MSNSCIFIDCLLKTEPRFSIKLDETTIFKLEKQLGIFIYKHKN